MIYLPNGTTVVDPKEKLYKLLQPHFRFSIYDRISIIADVKHFNIKEDESVWEQARGRRPNYFEAYWDGVWICDFEETDNPPLVAKKFLEGFLNAYQAKQVHLNTQEELAEHNLKSVVDQALEKADKLPETTKEERISKQVIKEVLQEKKNGAPKRSH